MPPRAAQLSVAGIMLPPGPPVNATHTRRRRPTAPPRPRPTAPPVCPAAPPVCPGSPQMTNEGVCMRWAHVDARKPEDGTNVIRLWAATCG
jgi:hypothetical protein